MNRSSMKCGRLQLCERRRLQRQSSSQDVGKGRPRRYCQQKMVNPNHEEDPRWTEGALERFRCDQAGDTTGARLPSDSSRNESEDISDLFLTVLNINFPGDCLKSKYTRSCFQYKMPSAEDKHSAHRMFVKQPIERECCDSGAAESNESQSEYKFDDYVKDILNGNDLSRPSTSVSECLYENPTVDHRNTDKTTMRETSKSEESTLSEESEVTAVNEWVHEEETKTSVKYQCTGKRRSLTISRAQSPETVQVIRVDVVCNYSGSTSHNSSFIDCKLQSADTIRDKPKDTDDYIASMRHRAAYANKYILTNTLKQLDETIGGGDKVTLLCKTFKLSSRKKKLNVPADSHNNNFAVNKSRHRKGMKT